MRREDWDERYGGEELVWSAGPNRLLAEELAGMAPGTALDVACGEGRNAIWLAEQGWRVTGADFSPVGLAKAAEIAARRGVTVHWVEADVTRWDPPGQFNLVCVLYLQLPAAQRRAAYRRAASAVAPGGELLVIAHDRDNLLHGVGGPQDPDVLVTATDVVTDVTGDAGEGAPGGERPGVGTFTVERASTARRAVEGEGDAIDTIVRMRRIG